MGVTQVFSNSRVFFNTLEKVSASIGNIIRITRITFEFIDNALLIFLTMVNKLLIHKQPWKTWETEEVNQLHLIPLFELKVIKANEKDFY